MHNQCYKLCARFELVWIKNITDDISIFLFSIQTRTSIIRYDDVTDPLGQAQVKLADNVLLFVKGCGWLTSVTLPNVQSIEERRASKVNRDKMVKMKKYWQWHISIKVLYNF